MLDEFEFGPSWTFHYGVIRLLAFPVTLNGKMVSPSFLFYYEPSLHQTFDRSLIIAYLFTLQVTRERLDWGCI